jgi:hypothetical protein
MMEMPLRTDADGADGAQGQPPPVPPPIPTAFQLQCSSIDKLSIALCLLVWSSGVVTSFPMLVLISTETGWFS